MENKIWVIGGNDGSDLNIVEIYDPLTDTWTTGPSMNVSRRLPNTWVVNNRIYTGGGFGASDGGYLSSIELFDPIANQWVFAGSLPQNKYSSSCVNLNGKIFIMGGRDRFDAVTGNYLNKLHVADYSTVTSVAVAKVMGIT